MPDTRDDPVLSGRASADRATALTENDQPAG